MFDFGFSELLVIGVVALIVIGPERLPKVARTVGHLLGRIQRYVSDVKEDIRREIQLDELKKLQTQVEERARAFETSVRSELSEVESQLEKNVDEVKQGVEELKTLVEEKSIGSRGEESHTDYSEDVVEESSPQLKLGLTEVKNEESRKTKVKAADKT